MASVTVVDSSWLNLTSLLEFQGTLFWDQTEYPDIPYSDGDTYLQITDIQARRIDQLAYQYYGDSNLMWMILLANNKMLPNQFMGAEMIRIPAKATINSLLKKQ